MSRCKKKISRWLIPLLMMAVSDVGAITDELASAVQLYYAGRPDQAINAIKSMALAGDVEAQLTLGNILYGLSQANQHMEFEDSIIWYDMAAAQGSAEANAALGVIHHNQWIKSRSNEDAAMAIAYYERAIELGDTNAEVHLSKLRRRGGFSAGEILLPKPKVAPRPAIQTVQPSIPVVEKPAPKPEVSTKPSIETVQASSEVSSSKPEEETPVAPAKPETGEISTNNPTRVKLTEVADQCGKYTAEGFAYYGESIVGSLLVGKAAIESVEPPVAQADTQLVRLVQKQSNSMISLALHNVPEEVATKLVDGSGLAVSGIVTDAQMIDSNCEISLSYQPAE